MAAMKRKNRIFEEMRETVRGLRKIGLIKSEVSFGDDLKKSLAEATKRNIAWQFEDSLEETLEDIEDVELAEQRLKNIRDGKSKTVSLIAKQEKHHEKDNSRM
jgi:predicted DNA-binding protein